MDLSSEASEALCVLCVVLLPQTERKDRRFVLYQKYLTDLRDEGDDRGKQRGCLRLTAPLVMSLYLATSCSCSSRVGAYAALPSFLTSAMCRCHAPFSLIYREVKRSFVIHAIK